MNLKTRIAKLEAIAHERLAAASARNSIIKDLPLELQDPDTEDVHALYQRFQELLHPEKVAETPNYRILLAHYRRVPFLVLVRLYPQIKRFQAGCRAIVQQVLDKKRRISRNIREGKIAEVCEELCFGGPTEAWSATPTPQPDAAEIFADPAPQPAGAENITAPPPAPAPEPWQPGWCIA